MFQMSPKGLVVYSGPLEMFESVTLFSGCFKCCIWKVLIVFWTSFISYCTLIPFLYIRCRFLLSGIYIFWINSKWHTESESSMCILLLQQRHLNVLEQECLGLGKHCIQPLSSLFTTSPDLRLSSNLRETINNSQLFLIEQFGTREPAVLLLH